MNVPPPRIRLQRIARTAMLERTLDPDFSAAAQAEAERLREPPMTPSPGLRDMRRLIWCSIDNDDSRDLDQLTVAEAVSDALTMFRVAVADVSALVAKDSALDQHAQKNTTTVYTEAQIFPMLPLRLSTDLTSLNPDEDRLAIVVEGLVDEAGSVSGGSVYRALVRNHAKLTYNEVGHWLEDATQAPDSVRAVEGLEANLRLQDVVARRLSAARHEHGALDLESDEPKAVFDNDTILDLKPRERNRAGALIEDFMIAANGITARFLEANHIPALRRIVRSPERWARIVQLAWDHEVRLPDQPDSRALAEFLRRERAENPQNFPVLSLAVLKLLGRGEYVAEIPGDAVPGHFGLAVDAYTHSTAPNRRFPDLVTQRLVKAALDKHPLPYAATELVALAARCTQQEDNANKVERAVRKSAAALLLEHRIGAKFDSVVTGASAKGTWVRIWQPSVEGKLDLSEERQNGHYQVGDHVRVRLVHTDVERGFIDFKVI
jgi:VacB/RNase II family 3'-5' exoribonuclease